MDYDVVIAGGGPAGCAAALSLRQLDAAVTVAILDGSSSPAWRGGESLAPGCADLLRSLGCWDRFRAENFLESYGTRAAWGAPDAHENEFLFSTRGNGWHVDRARFDALLAEEASRAGATVFRAARATGVERGLDGAWRVALGSGEGLLARFLIDATGRRAVLAAALGAKRVPDDNLVGVLRWYRLASEDARTLVEAQSDGWWYSSVLPGGRLLAAWMSDADLVRGSGIAADEERWAEHLRRSPLTWRRMQGARPDGPISVLAAQSQYTDPPAGPGWAAAGDAASAFDPLSSQGVLKALRSGKIASFVALDSLRGKAGGVERFRDMVRAEYESYRVAKWQFYMQEQRWPDLLFWRRRLERSVPAELPHPGVAGARRSST